MFKTTIPNRKVNYLFPPTKIYHPPSSINPPRVVSCEGGSPKTKAKKLLFAYITKIL